MATTYKLLGQAKPNAARAPQIYNLIKNPSFEGKSLEGWNMGQADWRYRWYPYYSQNEQNWNTSANYAYDQPESYPQTWGSNISLRWYSDADISMGIFQCANPWTASYRQGEACNFPENLMPVRGGKIYYMAYSAMLYTNSVNNTYMRVEQWDGDKRFIRYDEFNFNPEINSGTWIGGIPKWTRPVTTLTLQDDAVYCSVSMFTNNGSNSSPYIDDIYFGEYAEYAYAPFNPDTPDLTYMAPYDKRRFGYIGEQHNSYTGRTFAGPNTLLYTVPASTATTVSSMIINNIGKVHTPYRIAIVPSGETIGTTLKHFNVFDEVIKPRNSHTKVQGLTLSAGDRVYVAADSGEVNFNLFGAELS